MHSCLALQPQPNLHFGLFYCRTLLPQISPTPIEQREAEKDSQLNFISRELSNNHSCRQSAVYLVKIRHIKTKTGTNIKKNTIKHKNNAESKAKESKCVLKRVLHHRGDPLPSFHEMDSHSVGTKASSAISFAQLDAHCRTGQQEFRCAQIMKRQKDD